MFTAPGKEQTEATFERVSILFGIDELWLLQRCVRHEIVQQEQWKLPPASFDLNTQIAIAIAFCAEQNQTEAPLVMTLGDLMVLDYHVPQDAKDINGKPIGRTIILKTCKARAQLATYWPTAEATEPNDQPNAAKVKALLSARQQTGEN